MKIWHHHLFQAPIKSLWDEGAWETLRESNTNGFGVPREKTAYTDLALKHRNDSLVKAIKAKCDQYTLTHLHSVGVGLALLECNLKADGVQKVSISDFVETVHVFEPFGVFDGCYKLDLLKDKLPASDALLMSRLDTEFTDKDLSALFSSLASHVIKYIFFLPTQYLTWRACAVEVKIWLNSLLHLRTPTFCGYIRSRKLMLRLFDHVYSIESESRHLHQHLLILKIKEAEAGH